jgi:hypothetical protein
MRLLPLALLVLISVCSGCGTYAPPSLTVADATLAAESPEGYVLDFAIDAQNVNSVELPLKEVRYTVLLDGHPVFSGLRSPEASLRRLGTQRFHVPAAVPIDAEHPRPHGVQRYTLEGRLLYITPGQLAEVLFDIKIRRPTVTFRGEGTVDLGGGAQARR